MFLFMPPHPAHAYTIHRFSHTNNLLYRSTQHTALHGRKNEMAVHFGDGWERDIDRLGYYIWRIRVIYIHVVYLYTMVYIYI